MDIQIKITREQNKMLRKMLEGECATYKNWIATAVEGGKFEYAQKLVSELRERQLMFHIIKPDDMI